MELISFCANAGQREGPLRRKVAEHRRTLPSPKAQQAADAKAAAQKIVVKLGGSKPAGSGGGGGADGVVKAEPDAAPGADVPQAEPVAVDVAADAAAATSAAGVFAADAAQGADAAAAPAEQAEAEQLVALATDKSAAVAEAAEGGATPKVLKLRKALRSLRGSLSDEVIDPIRCGSTARYDGIRHCFIRVGDPSASRRCAGHN